MIRTIACWITVAILLPALIRATPAWAVVIDDFEVGNVSLKDEVADFDGDEITQLGLPTANAIAGRRSLSVELLTPEAVGIPNAITADLVTTGALDDALALSSISRAVGHLEMEWFGITQSLEDLTDGGTQDRFLIEIPSANVPFSLVMLVRTKVSTAVTHVSASPVVTVLSPGTVELPFNRFEQILSAPGPADFTELDSIFISLTTANDPPTPWTIEISQITTGIPEPTTGLLIIPASLGLVFARHR